MLVMMVMVMLMLVMMVMAMLVVVLMLMTAAAVMFMVMLLDFIHQLLGQVFPALHGREDLRPGELIPGGGENGGFGIFCPQQGDGPVQLVLVDLLGAGKDDGAGVLHLVVEELAEVLHVDLGLGGVHHGDETVQVQVGGLRLDPLHGGNDIGELAYAGGLNDDAGGGVVGQHLLQGRAEVTHQGAADAPGVHLGDLYPGVLEEAAVDADFAKFVLNQDDLFTLEGLIQQFLDQRGLSRAQKSGDNVDFGH